MLIASWTGACAAPVVVEMTVAVAVILAGAWIASVDEDVETPNAVIWSDARSARVVALTAPALPVAGAVVPTVAVAVESGEPCATTGAAVSTVAVAAVTLAALAVMR